MKITQGHSLKWDMNPWLSSFRTIWCSTVRLGWTTWVLSWNDINWVSLTMLWECQLRERSGEVVIADSAVRAANSATTCSAEEVKVWVSSASMQGPRKGPKGLAVHELLLHSKFLWYGIEAEIFCVWSVWVTLLQLFQHYLRR